MNLRQSLERRGRRLLMTLGTLLFGVQRRPVVLSAAPRILVMRLDERLGNLLLLTPILRTLRQRFPARDLRLIRHSVPEVNLLRPARSCLVRRKSLPLAIVDVGQAIKGRWH